MSKILVFTEVPADAPLSGEEALARVNADLEAFNTWFKELGNDPLVNGELAILRTYLAYKLGLKQGASAP